jgi:hypothetical protein
MSRFIACVSESDTVKLPRRTFVGDELPKIGALAQYTTNTELAFPIAAHLLSARV